MWAIDAAGLTRSFQKQKALDGVSLQVRVGEIFGLVGPDGAGKTTCMRVLTGLLAPEKGTALVAGHDVISDPEGVRDRIAYMSQKFGLYQDLTVLENLTFYADLFGVPREGREALLERLLNFSRMGQFRHREAGKLSGGMKQKLGLACALIHRPKVLFLDEPTNGVDPVSRREFWKILQELRQEKVTMFVSTAYLDEAERFDRLALLHQGRLVAMGTPDEVKKIIPGEVWELRVDHPRAAQTFLREAFGEHRVTLFGDRLHFLARDPSLEKPIMEANFQNHQIRLLEQRVLAPSLEDVFVAVLHGDATSEKPTADPRNTLARLEEKNEEKAPKMAVDVQNLTKRFGDFVAVNQVSLRVGAGEIFGFLGPNGAGKSTTIRMLCGLLPPDDGSGSVAGIDLRTSSEEVKQHIGYMSQKFSLYEDLTVKENLAFFAGIYNVPGNRRAGRIDWAVEMAGLRGHEKSLTGTLPGGWKQRLALGCAILHEPPIVFLDEPTSGVDPISRRKFWDLIYQLSGSGTTVFVTTHYLEEAEYCHRVALIYAGNMIALGTPGELKEARSQEHRFAIACDRPHEAMIGLTDLPGLEEVYLFGRGLHLRTRAVANGEEAVRHLSGLGWNDLRLEIVPPTLEDVFIASIEEYDRKHPK